jgi:hypothetical protein
MTEDLDAIVGKKIWLEYFDQNTTFEQAFTSQYCKVLQRYMGIAGEEDWYLIELEIPFGYKGTDYEHLMIRSRWVDCPIGSREATAVFIVLVPDPDAITHPFEMDRARYIAWGFSALDPNDIKR